MPKLCPKLTNAYITRMSSAINKPTLVPKFTTHGEIIDMPQFNTNEIKCIRNLVELGMSELTLIVNGKELVTNNESTILTGLVTTS